MKYAAVDFESYYDAQVTLSLLGVWHYLRHEKCEIYMVSVFTEEGSFVGHPSEFDFESIRDCEWVSHNASFDIEVYKRLQELGQAPSWHPEKWHCSANMAAYFGASDRNLADAVLVHLRLDISKDVRKKMKGKTYESMVETGFIEEVKEYALRDAEACYKLWMAKKEQWPQFEQDLSALTMLQVQRGIPCDAEYLEEGIKKLSQACFTAVHRLPWAEGNEEHALSTILFAAECRKVGIDPPKSKAKNSSDAAEWEEENPGISWIEDRRVYLRANLLRTKLQTMKSRIRDDGRIHFGIKYFGAHTGRWSGDNKLNVQGLTKEVLHGFSQRRVLHVTDPNKKFIIFDLSQIEPRCSAWVVGDWDFLSLCQTQSVYEAHARQTMGWTGGNLKLENPKLYAAAKVRILGGDYGQSAVSYQQFAKSYGVIMTLDAAKRDVADYRAKEWRKVQKWNEFDAKLKEAAQNQEPYEIVLPSGRTLTYRNARFALTASGKTNVKCQVGGGRWTFTWGSKIYENVIQSIARDVFCESLLRLEKAGWESIFTVHDEGILEVPKSVTVEEVQELIKINPPWMPDVPLDSEAVESDFYLK